VSQSHRGSTYHKDLGQQAPGPFRNPRAATLASESLKPDMNDPFSIDLKITEINGSCRRAVRWP
jgi:hypothetical protein